VGTRVVPNNDRHDCLLRVFPHLSQRKHVLTLVVVPSMVERANESWIFCGVKLPIGVVTLE
jgi:hypothetical protein